MKFHLSKDAVTTRLADISKLSDNQACKLLAECRWGSKTEQICPSCGCIRQHYWLKTRLQWRCKDCGHTFSITSGTPFHDHKVAMNVLAQAIFLFSISPKGLAALQLRRILGVQYRTAFTLLHKMREAIMLQGSSGPLLSGIVEIDGGHFSGKKRKPRKSSKLTAEEKTEIPAKYLKGHRSKLPPTLFPHHPNRRIVMVLRELDTRPKAGAVRTLTVICRSENAADVKALITSTVARGATIRSDELPAYGDLKLMGFAHETVNHSKEFSTDEGINQNQAESFFSRMRRAYVGIYHRITPKYMLDYSREMAWREDHRRKGTLEQFTSLAKLVLNARPSRDWCKYTKDPRFKRQTEILFGAPAAVPA